MMRLNLERKEPPLLAQIVTAAVIIAGNACLLAGGLWLAVQVLRACRVAI